ncbi:histidine kinase dimerization/phosphoacceptor domain -containing protein [Belnapia moabensis]|uniref:histidine kinase dimerization/phosphoacceptor domain -containing protein n=1 Tax=Belnapia moabensis TaxID=365533 RepID=UPI0009FD550F|nr:histidine kinase dimerization/phosphoacceptor domain -containing protein [Belnapia moabensis]
MEPVDLTACDREPIQTPAAVQPHGALLVVNSACEEIIQTAGDTQGLLAHERPPLGRRVGEVLGVSLEALMRLSAASLDAEPVYLGSVRPAPSGAEVDVVAHARGGVVILELEPAPASRPAAARLLGELRAIAAALAAAPDLPRMYQTAVHMLRRLTGFDRVMIYRFLEEGSGCVLAEDRESDLPSFLNHHYPASDIPRQARELYLRNLIRVVPNVGYTPASLVPSLTPTNGQPLDMSDCTLRSVSPVHVQYLQNMGVGASMSISIVHDEMLWGLVACHHRTGMLVSYELREACKHVGQILSQQIAAREEAQAHTQAQRLAEGRDDLLMLLGRTGQPIEEALAEHTAELLTVVPSDGVAVCRRGEIIGAGHRPSNAEIQDLADWLLRDNAPDPYATDRLSKRHGPASAYRARASGLLATVVSHEESLLLLWFRGERAQVIEWAGNPHKPVEPGSDSRVLTPRTSFELWREAVHGHSRPWTVAEVDAVRRFRDAAFELGRQRRLDELNSRLRQTLADKERVIAQKDLLMREVHHRLQNSLQLVNSMLMLQEREVADPHLAKHFAEARRRILAVSAVHRRLWRSDQIQSIRFDTYMNELRDGLVEEWGKDWDRHIRTRVVPVLVPTDAAVGLALVVTELLTNAVKHAYGGAPGPIDITIASGPNGSIRITVADQGSGMKQTERPGGFGSRLTRMLMMQVKGQLAIQDNRPGTRVVLTAPLLAGAEGRPELGGGIPRPV